MAVSSGFYNSVYGDRKYNAVQMSSIFDGIIEDGVYNSIGDRFSVTASEGNEVIVGTGRAWFNHTWTLNDADYPLTIEQSEVVLNRYDAIVIEVNASNAVRGNSIKIVKGKPGSSPSKPKLANGENNVWQHPIAYVYVSAGSSSISQSNIEYVVGTSECPFVVAAVQSVDIDALVAQWQNEFDTWFENLEVQLSGDVAGNLQNQINQRVEKAKVIDDPDALALVEEEGFVAGAKASAVLLDKKMSKYDIKASKPVKTGRTFLGKDEWFIMLDVGALPNATTKTFNIPINPYYYRIDPTCSFAYGPASSYPIPYTDPNALKNAICVRIDNSGKRLVISTASNWSTYAAIIGILYTEK